MKSSRVN